MSQESDRSLLTNLSVLSQLVGADTVALFAVTPSGIRLRQSQGLHEHDLDIARGTFQELREELTLGRPVEINTRSVWPLVASGTLEGLVYFDAPLPHAQLLVLMQRVLDQVHRWLKEAFDEPVFEAAAPQLARYDPEEAKRQQLVTALLRYGGNVSAIASAFGVTRQTIYDRAERLKVDIARYRVTVRRRKKSTTH